MGDTPITTGDIRIGRLLEAAAFMEPTPVSQDAPQLDMALPAGGLFRSVTISEWADTDSQDTSFLDAADFDGSGQIRRGQAGL